VKTWVVTSLIFAVLASPARAVAATDSDHDAQRQVLQVIERFQTAVIKKDRAALETFSYP